MSQPANAAPLVAFAAQAVNDALLAHGLSATPAERVKLTLDFLASWLSRANAPTSPTINIKWDIPK